VSSQPCRTPLTDAAAAATAAATVTATGANVVDPTSAAMVAVASRMIGLVFSICCR